MLRHTFIHLPGVGLKTEQALWQKGIKSWDVFLDEYGRSACSFGRKKYETLSAHLWVCRENLDRLDANYFAASMPPRFLWRIFPDFRHHAAYLDIETTGLGGPTDHITTVAVYDGKEVFHYIDGKNLHRLPKDLEKYKLLITYNGTCFDLPFISNSFGISLKHAHIDLRYLLAGLGYRGGLKGCEKSLGLDRGELDGVDGYLAVLLWNEYGKKRNPKALETLLAYNMTDAINLENLMVQAFNMEAAKAGFSDLRLPVPPAPDIEFHPDPQLIEKLRLRYF